jgi:site-specific recombinase XerD
MASVAKNQKPVDELLLLRRLLRSDYIDHLESRGIAVNTSLAYRQRILQFLDWLADSGRSSTGFEIAESRDKTITDYKEFLESRKLQPRTISAMVTAISDFAEYLGNERPYCKRKTQKRNYGRFHI